MKYLKESYWKSRKEKNEDISDIKFMLADFADNDIQININAYDNQGTSYISYDMSPKNPEKDWPNNSYLKWNQIKYKVNQIIDMLDNKYEINKVKIKLRWPIDTSKEWIILNSLDIDQSEYNEFNPDKTCLSYVSIDMKLK